MATLAEELGVKFILNEEVIKIENDGDVISTVITKMEFTPQIWWFQGQIMHTPKNF